MAVALLGATEVYNIYPVPHEQVLSPGTASFTQRVFIFPQDGIDIATINRAKQILSDHGLVPVVIDAGTPNNCPSFVHLSVNNPKEKIGDEHHAVLRVDRSIFNLPKYDRHILNLKSDSKGLANVAIIGEDTDAVFCGLASLEQMLDQGTTDLPCVTIYDWADVKNRGIIEGYYGVPYSAEVTKDLFRFMAR